jgi:hypothetical protein
VHHRGNEGPDDCQGWRRSKMSNLFLNTGHGLLGCRRQAADGE